MKKLESLKNRENCVDGLHVPFIIKFATNFIFDENDLENSFAYSEYYKGYIDGDLVLNRLRSRY